MAIGGGANTEHDASSDRWLAVLAGRAVWEDRDRPIRLPEQLLALAQALMLVALTAVLAERWFEHDHRYPSVLHVVIPVALFTVAAVAIVGPLRIAVRRQVVTRRFWPSAILRSTIGLVFVLLCYAISPGFEVLYGWPLGVAAGIDGALAAQAIGWRPSFWQAWRSLATSPMHMGVLGGLAGTVAIGPGTELAAAASVVYVTLQFGVANFAVWATLTSRVLAAQQARVDELRSQVIADERRRSAHWLHDDICASLRLVTLQVQQRRVTTDETVRMLDELDHTLRLRQLDELIASGTVRLADVLQPFVRSAQNQGALVDHVPSYEVAAITLERRAADQVRHALAVFTSNALNAGAGRISFAMTVDAHDVSVGVIDDAGGFDLTDLHVGRGLWNLRAELGDDRVTVERVGAGSCVTARIARNVDVIGTPSTEPTPLPDHPGRLRRHYGQPAHR